MFKRILVANRGEIALRIFRACREMGIETVAVFSEADRGASYLELADEAYCIGPPKASESYLKIHRIISAAEIGNVQAIHPGYGFLAENSHFADVCRECNIVFIGPTPEAMGLLGDKNSARAVARKAKVPTVPGSEGLIESEAQAVQLAKELGYPVLIKASAGGGGRGMRVAANDLALKSALDQASAEAAAAFGSSEIYLEKYIEHPRHVEVQIMGDTHGNVVHLWERDCTMQRRHQKLIEESPSPNLTEATRKAICESAVRLAKSSNYFNAGTVEFIVDKTGSFFFIEMNARIQVEHPVTEAVTGVDLIAEQIAIADGAGLRLAQADIQSRGCAIECRVNAEDPANDFRPSPGLVREVSWPSQEGIRVDTHIAPGSRVPPFYDSLLGKIIAHAPDRAGAVARLRRAIASTRLEGVHTNLAFHETVLSDREFEAGGVDTEFVARLLERQAGRTEYASNG
jgi:acetyl-CoA carboxylase biotin carboxylase subunit